MLPARESFFQPLSFLSYHSNAVTVRLISQVRNAGELLFVHQLCDALKQRGLMTMAVVRNEVP